MSERSCTVCDAPLTGRQLVTCSQRCRNYRNNHSDAYRRTKHRYREAGGERPRFAITCGWCGVACHVTKRTSRFCSNRCYQDCKLSLRLPSSTALVHVGPLERPAWEPSHSTSGRRWVAGRCSWCDDPFVIVDQVTARFCSTRCRKADEKVRRGRFAITDRRRWAIYRRDGWVCQLCDEPVDRGLPPSDMWAATLDHIECQSWGDEPDHSDGNLRLAHRWCNSVRSDEGRHAALKVA